MIGTEEAYWNERYNTEERYFRLHYDAITSEATRPSYLYKPKLSIDGNQWCALYGENLQDGVAGFGDTPEKAYEDFDREWKKPLPPRKQEGE